MARRHNHYDAAFEEFLRDRRIAYVAVDEQRRSLLEAASLKSMDFIVSPPRHPNLLVDVKGRQFPSGGPGSGHKWENWATGDDLESLLEWQQVFGDGFRALLVFAYHVLEPRFRDELADPFDHRRRTYAFYGVWADEYREAMRVRSSRWETVSLPLPTFRRLCVPIHEFL